MLVFRGSPKSSRRSIRLIDEMRREELEAVDNSTKQSLFRRLPKVIVLLFLFFISSN
jgi:cell division cycle protein 20 (cofactor of APC complex)